MLLTVVIPESIRRLAELLEVDAGELLRDLLKVGVVWLVAWLGVRLMGVLARRIERAVDDGDPATLGEREQRGRTISQLLRSVGTVAFVLLGALLSLNVFINIAPLLAGAGILGLAVSFGAQSLVKDVIAGFFYLVEGQFAVGDVIEVAGKSGEVERMTLRVVMLRDADGALHIVPNGQITTVSNRTRKWSQAVVDVGVDYTVPVDRALAVFRDEAAALAVDPAWAAKLDGAPEVLGIQGLDESAVTLRTLLRTPPGKQWEVAREFRRRLKNRLDREGIGIPFGLRTVLLRPQDAAPPAPARGTGSSALPPR